MGINDDKRRHFWAEQGGVRLGCERAPMGQIKFIIDHPAGSNHATVASYRVADLCRFLETDLAKRLDTNQKHIAKLMAVVDAARTIWVEEQENAPSRPRNIVLGEALAALDEI